MSIRRTSRRTAAAIVVGAALTLTACGDGSAGTSTSTAPTGSAVVPSDGTSPTPTDSASEPPGTDPDTSLAAWVSSVCASSKDALAQSQFTYDPQQFAGEPLKALRQLTKQFRQLPEQLQSFADELEAIGPPPIQNGPQYTAAYIELARTLAAELEEGLAQSEAAGGGIAGLQPLVAALMSPKVRQALKDLAQLGRDFAADQELAAAVAAAPECQGLDDPSGTGGDKR